MFNKIKISGKIKVESGMHIGGSDAFASIGATDSPVIKDPLTGKPIIPGSSFKGKMRTVLAKNLSYKENKPPANNADKDPEQINRLFGNSKKQDMKIGRLTFSDSILSNWDDDLEKKLDTMTEVKFENTIDRITAVANPRQIERAVRGSVFDFEIVYELRSDNSEEDIKESTKKDFQLIKEGFELLELSGIGGGVSRGNGRISFTDLGVENAFGENIDFINDLKKIIGEKQTSEIKNEETA